jgi:hypothetical protein
MTRSGLKLFDYFIIGISIIIVAISSYNIYSSSSDERVLRIDASGTDYLYPLDKDAEIEIEGSIGPTHIIIHNGEAHISESPCDNKLCILMGSISKTGQWAACMPNRVFISIEGGKDDQEIDVLSY